MSTLPTVSIDGTDLTAELQDRSMSVKRNGADMLFIDPSDVPQLGDLVEITDPDWIGVVTGIESTGYKGDVPYIKVRAVNDDALPDLGAAAFDLSDTPDDATTFGFKDLTISRVLDGTTNEVRAKCSVFEEGLLAGNEIALTSVVEGFSAETFTIMDLTTEWPVSDGAVYHLDLGLGDYATATTGGADGGPLDPTTFKGEVERVASDSCCDGDGGDGGGSTADPCSAFSGPCRLVDDFNRTEASGWGTSSGGQSWSHTPYTEQNPGVTPTHGVLIDLPTRTNLHGNQDTDGEIHNAQVIYGTCTDLPVDGYLEFVVKDNLFDSDDAFTVIGADIYDIAPSVISSLDGHQFSIIPGTGQSISIVSEGGTGYLFLGKYGSSYYHAPSTTFSMAVDTSYSIRFQLTSDFTKVRIWETLSTEPSTWDAEIAFNNSFYSGSVGLQFDSKTGLPVPGAANSYPETELWIEGFELNTCTGTSSPGPFEESASNWWREKNGINTLSDHQEQSQIYMDDGYIEIVGGEDNSGWIKLAPGYYGAGTGSTAKVIVDGGHGLVFPTLTADPAGGSSENGQVYYNSTSHKLRVRANGSWIDLH